VSREGVHAHQRRQEMTPHFATLILDLVLMFPFIAAACVAVMAIRAVVNGYLWTGKGLSDNN